MAEEAKDVWLPIASGPKPGYDERSPMVLLAAHNGNGGWVVCEGFWRRRIEGECKAALEDGWFLQRATLEEGWVSTIDSNIAEPNLKPKFWRPLPAPPQDYRR